ncbi:MAG TPA: TetR/AcrR family transcriptional regulator [Mycobacteriales bacterium]|nr:TetR/AcrR family transcriptional regulator [Mycobacteriales bacterium]
MATTLSRRERVRAATVAEIKETARRILVAEGPDGLSLRAIAREMGMTAPALYRYFPSREDLVIALIADLYDELTEALEAARDGEAEAGAPFQLGAASREFRGWALANRREFELLFGSPIPGRGEDEDDDDPAHQASERFGLIFGGLVARIYLDDPFPIPADEEIPPELRQELETWRSWFPVELPLGAAQVFLSCWIQLYGMVAMEVFGHLRFALSDAEPMFESELRDLATKLGFADKYPPSPPP